MSFRTKTLVGLAMSGTLLVGGGTTYILLGTPGMPRDCAEIDVPSVETVADFSDQQLQSTLSGLDFVTRDQADLEQKVQSLWDTNTVDEAEKQLDQIFKGLFDVEFTSNIGIEDRIMIGFNSGVDDSAAGEIAAEILVQASDPKQTYRPIDKLVIGNGLNASGSPIPGFSSPFSNNVYLDAATLRPLSLPNEYEKTNLRHETSHQHHYRCNVGGNPDGLIYSDVRALDIADKVRQEYQALPVIERQKDPTQNHEIAVTEYAIRGNGNIDLPLVNLTMVELSVLELYADSYENAIKISTSPDTPAREAVDLTIGRLAKYYGKNVGQWQRVLQVAEIRGVDTRLHPREIIRQLVSL